MFTYVFDDNQAIRNYINSMALYIRAKVYNNRYLFNSLFFILNNNAFPKLQLIKNKTFLSNTVFSYNKIDNFRKLYLYYTSTYLFVYQLNN